MIFDWQYELCFAECMDISQIFNVRCCVLQCGLRFLKVIGSTPQLNGIDAEGLKFSFILSVRSKFWALNSKIKLKNWNNSQVDNDTRWIDAVDSSVSSCDAQFHLDVPKIANVTDPDRIKAYEDFWDCFETIPKYLYTIIDCAYFANL